MKILGGLRAVPGKPNVTNVTTRTPFMTGRDLRMRTGGTGMDWEAGSGACSPGDNKGR